MEETKILFGRGNLNCIGRLQARFMWIFDTWVVAGTIFGIS